MIIIVKNKKLGEKYMEYEFIVRVFHVDEKFINNFIMYLS